MVFSVTYFLEFLKAITSYYTKYLCLVSYGILCHCGYFSNDTSYA